MITLTDIRKVFKLCQFDPKEQMSQWSVFARDLTPNAHFNQARICINFYFDGVKRVDVLFQAVWHLLAGLAKNEEIRAELQEAKRSNLARKNNANAEDSGVDSNTNSR